MQKHKYTKEEIDYISKYYIENNWDKIFEKYPNFDKKQIYSKMSKLNIHPIKYQNGLKGKDLSGRKKWTREEIKILIDNYSSNPIEQTIKLLPNRSYNSVITKSKKLGLTSFTKENTTWKLGEIDYIIKNWEIQSDYIMSLYLNRTFRSVKWKREELGLYRQDKDNCTYESISKYIRGNILEWKLKSMEQCNYQCIFTQSKEFQIHHLYGVSQIIQDIVKRFNIILKDNFSDYDADELSFILEKFHQEQDKYPLGVCVSKDIHVLFHSSYGQYYNTPEQWYEFEKDYKLGLYKNFYNKTA